MADTYLNYPFDDDIFIRAWGDEPDPVRIALIESGVLVEDPRITSALAGDGNYFTVPFYKPLGDGGGYVNEVAIDGTSGVNTITSTLLTGPANYNGQIDVPVVETEGGMLSGVAYGRTQGFKERDFVPELSGSDPMGHIVRKVSEFWNRYRQSKLVGVLNGIMSVTDQSWNTKHSKTINRPAYPEKLIALLNTELTGIFGQLKYDISVLVMDSVTAAEFENINLLHFERGVDAGAMRKSPRIGRMLDYTVIVDDTAMGTLNYGLSAGQGYIYALGSGAFLTGKPRLDRPAELVRDAIRFGGQTTLVTRIRDVIHPNGFVFNKPQSDWTESPSDAQLIATANYDLVYPEKTVMIARLLLQNDAGTPGDDAIRVFITGGDPEAPLPVVIDTSEGAIEVTGAVTVENAEGTELKVEVTNFDEIEFPTDESAGG